MLLNKLIITYDNKRTKFCLSFPSRDRETAPGQYEYQSCYSLYIQRNLLSDQARSGGSNGLLLYMKAVKVSHNLIIRSWSNCGVKQWNYWWGVWLIAVCLHHREVGESERWWEQEDWWLWLQCLLYGVLGNRTVRLWELAANKVECSLMCRKMFVDKANLICDDRGGLLTGASSGVQSRQRDSCVQKLPLATLETLIAISMLATHTWRASVGPRPRVTKSIVRKCQCRRSRAKRFVLINPYIFSWSSSCCLVVRPSLT